MKENSSTICRPLKYPTSYEFILSIIFVMGYNVMVSNEHIDKNCNCEDTEQL